MRHEDKYKRYLKLRSPKMTMWLGAVLGSVAFKACSITRSCVIRYCKGRRGEEQHQEEEGDEEEEVVRIAKRNKQKRKNEKMSKSQISPCLRTVIPLTALVAAAQAAALALAVAPAPAAALAIAQYSTIIAQYSTISSTTSRGLRLGETSHLIEHGFPHAVLVGPVKVAVDQKHLELAQRVL